MLGLQVHAQDKFNPLTDREFVFDALHSVIAILVLYIVVVLLLTTIKLVINYNLKKSLLEKDASEAIIDQILPKDKTGYSNALKWSTVLFAVGLGLLAINLFPTIGIHSLIIMVFSIAFGYLGFYLLTRKL